jgi:predicted amidohydrolase
MTFPIIIGGCQIPVTLDISQNLKEIKKAIDWASENNVDILSTPECALSGYLWAPNNIKDPRILQVTKGIEELILYSLDKKVDLILGTAQYNESNQWSDTLHFIISGKIEHIHYKNILFEDQYTPGNGVKTISYRGRTIAGLICSDIWANPITYPDASAGLVRSLIDQQCNILFVCANTPKDQIPLFKKWHNACVEMYANLGKLDIVVSENSYKMDGFMWDKETGVDAGIYSKVGDFKKAREHGTDYFKMSVYERRPYFVI